MACSNNFYWGFLYLISLRGLKSANIYVIDVSAVKDVDTLRDYEEYGIAYEDYIPKHNYVNKNMEEDRKNIDIVLCQRLFGSIYGITNEHKRCLEALKNKYNKEHGFDRLVEKYHHNSNPEGHYYNQVGRQHYNSYSDLTRFSQDYLDVNDLARSHFASDYVDINDFRHTRSIRPQCKEEFDEFGQITKTNCLPVSRKTLNMNRNFKNVKDSSESDVTKNKTKKENVLRKRKNKRYKVVSKESDDSSAKSDKSNDEKSGDDNNGSGSSIEDSDSIEVTTKKPKKDKRKRPRKEFRDSYMYLQGNKLYDQDDFRRNKLHYFRLFRDEDESDLEDVNENRLSRRSLRMSHFLPKRFHWDDDEYQNLGYYWFNGPQGKYKKWKS